MLTTEHAPPPSPYIEHGLWYLGYKPGLDQSSSVQEFVDAYCEIYDAYFENLHSTNGDDGEDADNNIYHGGVAYEASNWEYITNANKLRNMVN